jgi:hypothetical protein
VYFRRRPSRRSWLRRRHRFEIWRGGEPSTEVWVWELDALLDARRNPADYWAAAQAATQAYLEADESWIEFPSARRVTHPPTS